MSALRRDAPLLMDLPGDPPEIRRAAEAQAPAAASVAMFFVLPEGFVVENDVWHVTRRRRERDRVTQKLKVNRLATRRAGSSSADITESSFAPALPATVRCPQCQRPNEVTESNLARMQPRLCRRVGR